MSSESDEESVPGSHGGFRGFDAYAPAADSREQQEKRYMMCGCCGIVLFFFLIALRLCFATLTPLNYGLLKNTINGKVDLSTVYEPGFYFVGPFSKFLEFPSSVQTLQYAYGNPEQGVQQLAPLQLRSADGQPMHLEISLQYRRQKDGLPQLFRRAMSDTAQEDLFIAGIRSEFTKVMGNYKASECWQNRKKLIEVFKASASEVLTKNFASLWGFQFYRSHMEANYDKALVNTQLQKQKVQIELAKKRAAEIRAITKVNVSEFTKNIKVVESAGSAERYNIVKAAQAEAESNKTKAQEVAVNYIRTTLKSGGSGPNSAEITEYLKMLTLIGDLQQPQLYAGLGSGGKESYVLMPAGPGSQRRLQEESQLQLPQDSVSEREL